MQMQNEQKKIDVFTGLMKKEQKFLAKKKDSLYQMEFSMQKCEMRIDRLKGQAEDKTEIENKQKRIDELQASLNERMSTSKLLKNQIASLEVKLSCVTVFLQVNLIKKNLIKRVQLTKIFFTFFFSCLHSTI